VRRITKAALGGLAGCALTLGGVQAASGGILLQQAFPGWLTDLEADNVGPAPDLLPMTGAFDSAKAKLMVTETSNGKTTFSLEVEEIDGFAGREFGSHLHTGPCVPGVPTDAKGHYTNPGLDPRLPLEEREVWFKVVPNEDGVAADETVVPYVPKDPDHDGIMSIVIHRDPTNTDPGLGTVGGAGPREVCLPLVTTWG
jgi:Cu/Zn superoxide dismutase